MVGLSSDEAAGVKMVPAGRVPALGDKERREGHIPERVLEGGSEPLRSTASCSTARSPAGVRARSRLYGGAICGHARWPWRADSLGDRPPRARRSSWEERGAGFLHGAAHLLPTTSGSYGDGWYWGDRFSLESVSRLL